jgi:DNA repair exonuclease SbcCD ATPase subunit
MFLENHTEGFTFQPVASSLSAEVRVETGEVCPDECHFFLAVCAHRPQVGSPTFVYVPRAANVLRERERHIALLEGELRTKNEWLDEAKAELVELNAEHQKVLEMFRAQTAELEERNRWAQQLNEELTAARQRIAGLQEDFAREQAAAREMAAAYDAKIAELEDDVRAKTAWALETEQRLTAEVESRSAELARCVEALHAVEKEFEERTAWALQLEAETRQLNGLVSQCRASRWVKLGRKFGIGPELPSV